MEDNFEKRLQKEKRQKLQEMVNAQLQDENIPESDQEAARELCIEYMYDKKQYLVNGAKLLCDKAIPIQKGDNLEITLNVLGNTGDKDDEDAVNTINDRRAATIKDCEMNVNIEPVKCNCAMRFGEEEQRIISENQEDCEEYGTCKYLMSLNDSWENMINDTSYFTFDHVVAGKESERASGVTMMSALFCKRGGLITPVTSGQIYYKTYNNKKMRESVGYLAYGGNSVTKEASEGFYKLYDQPTIQGVGRRYDFFEIYDRLQKQPNGALQGFCGEASSLNRTEETTNYDGQELDVNEGTLKYDGIERYAIALGPMIQNPDFNTDAGEIQPTDMIYGTCVDVTIELEGITYYIPAIITDVKAHTYPNGYYQTGVDFSRNGTEWDEDKKGNIVEWYVVQKPTEETNKSLGLKFFNRTGGVIVYDGERMK